MVEVVPFLSGPYLLLLALLVFTRALDFASTWVATPHLVLEGNPIARKLGWRWGAAVHLILCLVFALFPLPAIAIATAAGLVAAHNFEGAWLMRTMGESSYRGWIAEQHRRARPSVFLLCLWAKTLLWTLAGTALIVTSKLMSVAMGIGCGMVGFSMYVTVYSSISVWRLRRFNRNRSN